MDHVVLQHQTSLFFTVPSYDTLDFGSRYRGMYNYLKFMQAVGMLIDSRPSSEGILSMAVWFVVHKTGVIGWVLITQDCKGST